MTEQERLLLLEQKNASRLAPKDSFGRIVRKYIKTALTHPCTAWRAFHSASKHKAAIKACGGLGDILRANAMLVQFYKEYPSVLFDVYIHNPALGRFLFGALPNVHTVYYEYLFPVSKKRYAFSFETLHLTELYYRDARLVPSALLENRNKIQDLLQIYQTHGEFAWRKVIRLALEKGLDYMDVLCLSAGLTHAGAKKANLGSLPLNPLVGQQYITFSTSSNIRDGVNTAATKCWPQEYWTELVALLGQAYPVYKLVQLGDKNAYPIKGADSVFLGKTDLQSACAILAGSSLHIDGDCGLVHFAKALAVPSVVLFGPTGAEYVGYAENENIKGPFCGDCWHTADTWQRQCPLGFKKAECMYSLSPEMVLSRIKNYLGENQ